MIMKKIFSIALIICLAASVSAQTYPSGLVDKVAAVIGNELITISDMENELFMSKAQGSGDEDRCAILESQMESKLFLMQARLDSLNINVDMVESELSQRLDQFKSALGGEDNVVEYFGKPIYKLRQNWRQQLENMSLIQQEQQNIASEIPELTPFDVKQFVDTSNVEDIPMVPIKYKFSQICVYPNRDSAAMACREKLLELRERIINGEKFATLARLYSEDTRSARRGGELGLTSKSIFWPAFSDAAMSLKVGNISQVVETPDGFHLIEVIEKKGDMFNARHILIRPSYSSKDQDTAFEILDSLKNDIEAGKISFEIAAKALSQDPATRTNGGQVANPATGSAYFDIDQLKPQDYKALQNLQEGEISEPIASLDNEGNDGHLVYKIVRLDKIVPAHTATFENDYNELLGVVRNSKQYKAIQDFLDKKVKETYIVIDPIFKDCNFAREGWLEKIKSE